MKVIDDSGAIQAISWRYFNVKEGNVVKMHGQITKEKQINVSHLKIVTSDEEVDAHTLLVASNKHRMLLKIEMEGTL